MKSVLPFAIVAALSFSGCSEKPHEQIATCWSPEAKKAVNDLARSIAIERIEAIIEARNGLDDAKRKKIGEVTSITLSTFDAEGYDPKTGHLTCGASVSFRFTKPDNGVLQGDTTTQFHIFQGETGPVYSIQRGPIIELVNSAE